MIREVNRLVIINNDRGNQVPVITWTHIQRRDNDNNALISESADDKSGADYIETHFECSNSQWHGNRHLPPISRSGQK